MRYWKRINLDGTIRTVESYSHNLDIEGAIEITKDEFDAYIAPKLIQVPKPNRDIATEIDNLKARIEKLERKK